MTELPDLVDPVVLLIDDSPAIHRLLTFRLKNDGLNFLSAFTGEEGLKLAAESQPSLILCDLNLKSMNGLDVLRVLKSNPQTMRIPIIVISGTSESNDKVRAFESGAMDFVAKPFDVHELRARIGSALRIQSLLKMLEQKAQIDGLTGLWNRTYFDSRLTAELNNVERKSHTLTLVLADLDHFKKLNDSFGHQAGDMVLEGFAKLLQREIRSCDIACRYGGEEFALILPDTEITDAIAVCDRIRQRLEARLWPSHPEIRATASFGLADRGIGGDFSKQAWIEAADRALYRAKQTGRNRCVVFNDSAMPAETPMRLAG